jgi:hypothetical protein
MYGTLFLASALGCWFFDKYYFGRLVSQVALLVLATRFIVQFILHRRHWAKLVNHPILLNTSQQYLLLSFGATSKSFKKQ